jgi:hypothetical protein
MRRKEEITIKVLEYGGVFAENKDIARALRTEHILPALEADKNIILDYTGVDNTTQSFTHALISDGIRKYNKDFFSKVTFKGCNEAIQTVISIVAEYMQRNISG